MVKKRAKLSGQGKELFFSETEVPVESKEKESTPKEVKSIDSSEKQGSEPAVPADFVRKITALQDMLTQLKGLVEPDEFKDLRGKDLEKYAK